MILVVASFAATNALAQPVIDETLFPIPRQTMTLDLNGDGSAEEISVTPLNLDFDVVAISGIYPPIAFVAPINLSDTPSLQRAPNGNLLVASGCFACGRYHTQTTLTIDWRDEELRVIGVDHTYADRLHAIVVDCSVNLLTGDAIIRAIGIDEQRLTSPERSYAVSDILERPLPEACLRGFARYDDDFMADNTAD